MCIIKMYFFGDFCVIRGGLNQIHMFCFEIMATAASIELAASSIVQQCKGWWVLMPV